MDLILTCLTTVEFRTIKKNFFPIPNCCNTFRSFKFVTFIHTLQMLCRHNFSSGNLGWFKAKILFVFYFHPNIFSKLQHEPFISVIIRLTKIQILCEYFDCSFNQCFHTAWCISKSPITEKNWIIHNTPRFWTGDTEWKKTSLAMMFMKCDPSFSLIRWICFDWPV